LQEGICATLAYVWIDQRGSEVVPLPECLRLLAAAAKKQAIGRLAVSQDQAPLLCPANFTYHDRLIVIRLGPGSIAEAATGSLVAFEVDDIDHDAGMAWSVLVRGLATVLVPGSEIEMGIESVPTPLVPEPGDILVAIRSDVVTGRRFPLLA
jgi:hypothetical protein